MPVKLDVASGEIVGIAGISGNGQRVLVSALAGEVLSPAETIRLEGVAIGRLGPRERRALGLRYVPEERRGHAAVAQWTLAENTFLTVDALRPRGVLNGVLAGQWTRAIIQRFDVRPPDAGARAGQLSGGNLQKFIVGRELHAEPRVLIVDQPTWGVDVGAAATIRNAVLELRARGCAIVMVSEELDELFELSDRIAVCAGHEIDEAAPIAGLSVEAVGQRMAGRTAHPAA
jgi:simple sugar transport system ATP-binding protein